jgi:hypothetical protein
MNLVQKGNVRYVGAYQIQGNHAPEINESQWRFLAQGDSWFSIGDSVFGIGTPHPLPINGSLLLAMDTPKSAIVVSAAYPGKTLAQMINPRQEVYFRRLISGPLSHEFDAVLLSGGGNDFIDALNIDPTTMDVERKKDRLLRTTPEWSNGQGPLKYVFEDGWARLLNRLLGYYRILVDWRDGKAGESNAQYPNRGKPLFTHSYDYIRPRPAPVLVGPEKLGPWVWAPLNTHGIPSADHDALVVWFLDRLAEFQNDLNANLADPLLMHGDPVANANIVSVNLHSLLKLADADAAGASNDWENEIHPTAGGYVKLAGGFVSRLVPHLG